MIVYARAKFPHFSARVAKNIRRVTNTIASKKICSGICLRRWFVPRSEQFQRKISFGAKYGIVISRSPSAWAPVISYEFLFCLHDHRLYWKICPDICLWTCINVIILVTQSSQFSSSYCLGNWSLPGTDYVRLGGSSSTTCVKWGRCNENEARVPRKNRWLTAPGHSVFRRSVHPKDMIFSGYYGFNENISFTFQVIKNLYPHIPCLRYGLFL